jgi:hypothetical protein
MSTRYMTGALFAILGGFLVVVSQTFDPTVLGWVAFAMGIGVVVVTGLAQLDRSRGGVQRILDSATVVLAVLMLVFAVTSSGTGVVWLTFAFSLGIVALAFIGLTVNEIANWRAGLELSNLRWMPSRPVIAPAPQQPRAA